VTDSVDIAALVARLELLENAELVRQATWRYAEAVDGSDFDALASAFTVDGSLTTSRGTTVGREAIVAYYRQALAEPIHRKHFLTNQKVTLQAPGEAVVESYFMFTYAGPGNSMIGWGTYVDRVVVEDGVARIAAKTITIDVRADSRVGWAEEVTS